MARPVPMPPPGFDELPPEEKVSYVQSLWDRIAADEARVPVPDWHRSELQQRLQDRSTDLNDTRDWEEVREELKRDLNRDADE